MHECVLQNASEMFLTCLSNVAPLQERTAMASDDRPPGASKQVGKEYGKGQQLARHQAERRRLRENAGELHSVRNAR